MMISTAYQTRPGHDDARGKRRIAMHPPGRTILAIALALAAASAGAQNPGGQLEEIVVTAQKREQNLQDVPLAISAISAEKVEKLDIRDSRDLSGLAPNVTIVQGTTNPSAAVISIRGIPTPAAETFGLDTANALYVDGIYIARSGASALDVSDIERVEVLRGPQGTLFGRNTTGGAIAFISRKPSKELRVKAEAGYGNYSAWNGRIRLIRARLPESQPASRMRTASATAPSTTSCRPTIPRIPVPSRQMPSAPPPAWNWAGRVLSSISSTIPRTPPPRPLSS
jgi:outer membrane receptor protein involved in Fe transport